MSLLVGSHNLLIILGFVVPLLFCGTKGNCSGKQWRKTAITGKLLSNHKTVTPVLSVQECAEKCTTETTCKSFGFSTDTLKCYFYDILIYDGGLFTKQSNVYYYWLLEDDCPSIKGYTFNTTYKICYQLFNDKLDWPNSLTKCDTDHGHLFIADNDDKLNLLTELLPGSEVHIGGTDEHEEGVWNWLNGVPINQWNPGKPDNYRGIQHCLATRSTGINDIECSDLHPLVCEIPVA